MDSVTAFTPDIRTLAVLIGSVALLASLVFSGLWLQGTGGRASGYWALGHAFGMGGFFLVGLRGVVPDLLSILLANPAILAAALLIVKGLRQLLGQPFPDRLAAAGLAAATLVLAYYTYLRPDLSVRTLTVSGLGAAILLGGSLTLLRLPAAQRRWGHSLIATAFAAVAAVQLLRFADTLHQPMGNRLMEASAIHGYSMAVVLVGLVSWTLGFFWLLTLRLRRDLEAEVTVRRGREQTLRESEQRFRAIFDDSATGIALADPEDRILLANQAFGRLLQRAPTALTGQRLTDLARTADDTGSGRLRDHLRRTGEDPFRLEASFVQGNGGTLWVELGVSAVRGEDSRLLHFVAVAHDIGARKARQHELEQQAAYDPLTGALNRRRFGELLEREQDRVDRYGTAASLIMMDIDHFKTVNDTRGHAAGDGVLQGLTGLIRDRLRQTDALARWGGEEFLVLLPETGVGGALALAEELRRTVAGHAFDGQLSITISVGVAALRSGEAVGDLLQRTDATLYAAKSAGRDRVEPDPQAAPAERTDSRRGG
ncbi:MAG TPA: diguanylate cyclase [Gammaproteobacteria bacterium]|nr:diguanylate cyclase [Gammaproteobacteria bacterium]